MPIEILDPPQQCQQCKHAFACHQIKDDVVICDKCFLKLTDTISPELREIIEESRQYPERN